jgi:glycosyltransferase involved in cell wall biosynthesis
LSSSAPPPGAIRRLAFVGTHLPRRCGIATFTSDLSGAVAREAPSIECLTVAMNDTGRSHSYPESVRFEIEEDEVAGYRRAGQFLNANQVDLVSLQHEYGIFGGKAGRHVLTLLQELRVPVVATLHTILTKPSADQKSTLDEIIAMSERLVVMSAHGRDTLHEVHGTPLDKIDVIPHGIPSPVATRGSKERLGFAGQNVLLTFGLLSPDKGLEYVVEALPSILRKHPNTIFVVLGATHPHVKERQGEAYRLVLSTRARQLGVDEHVSFHDRFVSDTELAEFLAAADVYLTPYLNAEQSTSGTLARAVSAGKAVISTPYWHARELLGDDRGLLVPPRDADAVARAVTGLLDDDTRRASLGRRAAEHGLSMVWPVVAGEYVKSFEAARAHTPLARRVQPSPAGTIAPTDLPNIDLRHLRAMTDETGILQHAAFAVPRYAEGYCLDDNARALLLIAMLDSTGGVDARVIDQLETRYLAFVAYAFDARRHRFKNFMSYSRHWSEDVGSEDSHGHAVWALGATIGRSADPGRSTLSGELFQAALRPLVEFSSPRAWAFGLLGIDEYLRAFEGDSGVQAMRRDLVARLVERYHASSAPNWPWFETSLTYANARLAQALIVSGSAMHDDTVTAVGLRALAWLATSQVSEDDFFAPVGSNGFYQRGGQKAAFDQQPIEAASVVSACLDALRVSRQPIWAEHACRAFDWFLGQNHLRTAVYDARTGGCRDGLHVDRPNENQGAESTLCFLLALVEMRSSDYARIPRQKQVRS